MDIEINRNGDEIIVKELGRPAATYHADTSVQVYENTMGLMEGLHRFGDLSDDQIKAFHIGDLDTAPTPIGE